VTKKKVSKKRPVVPGGSKIDTSAFKDLKPEEVEGDLSHENTDELLKMSQELMQGSEAFHKVASQQRQRRKKH
jgi:hypothetical protein